MSLACVVAVIFWAGIAARPTPPISASLPLLPADTAAGISTLVAQEQNVVVRNTALRIGLYRSADDPPRYAVELAPTADQAVRAADVLVYWADGSEIAKPDDNRILIGTLAGSVTRRLQLPAGAGPGKGQIHFYSLPEQGLVDAPWPLPQVTELLP